MAQVIFDDLSGNLATVTREPSFNTNFEDERLNHLFQQTADGGFITYDVGPTKISGVINFKNIDKSEADTLRTFIKTHLNFSQNSFTIIIDSFTNLDVGAGSGVNLTTCHFPQNTTKGVFTPRPPGNFDVTLPYTQDPT